MSYFKAKMHQIRFRLVSLQRSPAPLAAFKGATSEGKGGTRDEGKPGKDGREERGGEGER